MQKAITILALIVMLVFIPTSLFADTIKINKLSRAKWTNVVSENFDIVSNAKQKNVVTIARQLEKYRAFCLSMLGYQALPRDNKIKLVLAKNKHTWKALGLHKDTVSFARSNGASSVYIYADIQGFLGSSLRKPNRGRLKLLNMLTNEFLTKLDQETALPQWYQTGFAYYLSSYSEPKAGIMLGSLEGLRWRFASLYNSLGRFESFNVEELFTVDDVDYSSLPRNKRLMAINRYYVHSFITVHYFFADPEREKQLMSYLQRVNKGVSKDQAFTESFGITYQTLANRLKQYALGDKMLVKVFDREQVNKLLSVPDALTVHRLNSEMFLKRHARFLNEFGKGVIAEEDRQRFFSILEEKYNTAESEEQ